MGSLCAAPGGCGRKRPPSPSLPWPAPTSPLGPGNHIGCGLAHDLGDVQGAAGLPGDGDGAVHGLSFHLQTGCSGHARARAPDRSEPAMPQPPTDVWPRGAPGGRIPAWGSSPESALACATLEQTALPSEPHMQASAWPAVRGPEALAHTPRKGQWGHSPACPRAQPTLNEGPLRGAPQVRTYLLGAAEHVALRTGDTEFQQPLLLLNTHLVPARPRRALRGCSPRPRTLGPETSESPIPEHLGGAEGGDSSSPNYGRGSPRAAEGRTCPGWQAS